METILDSPKKLRTNNRMKWFIRIYSIC